MRAFLGVPIVAPEGVIGAFYLTQKEGSVAFGEADQELIELLAAHAAIAITNARLYERSRELSMMSERNRLALELHDVVSQKLFGLVLTAESAATLFERDASAERCASTPSCSSACTASRSSCRSTTRFRSVRATARCCASPRRRCTTRS